MSVKRILVGALLALCLLPCPGYAAGDVISRGEFLYLLWYSAGGVPFDTTAHPFTDLTGREELAQAVAWAWDLGLIRGVGEGLFAPDRPLTREECALILRRDYALRGRDVFLPDGAAACNDCEGISPWADDSLYWACIVGPMDWRYGELAPLEPVTRAEAESYLARELSLYRTIFSKDSQVWPASSMAPQVPNLSSTICQVMYQ